MLLELGLSKLRPPIARVCAIDGLERLETEWRAHKEATGGDNLRHNEHTICMYVSQQQ